MATGTRTSGSAGDVIAAWTNTYLSSATTTGCDLWSDWNTGYLVTSTSTTTGIWSAWDRRCQIQKRTRKQMEADQRALDVARAARLQAAQIAAVSLQLAKERSEKLLISVLTDQQRTELAEQGHFHVVAPSGALYRIKWGTHGNVKRIVDGREFESLCVAPNDVPVGDAMLAQVLHIQYNEEEFRRTANIRRCSDGYLIGRAA